MSPSSVFFLLLSTELVELKIEEFLASFGENLNALTEEAFNTQVCVWCVCPVCDCCVYILDTQRQQQMINIILTNY